jgi:hypothetical protein
MAYVIVSGVHIGPDRAASPDRAALNALMDRAAASARAGRWFGPGPILGGGPSGPGEYRTDWSRLFEPTPGDALAMGRLERDLGALLARAGGYSQLSTLAHEDAYGLLADYEAAVDGRAEAPAPVAAPRRGLALSAPLVIGVGAIAALLLAATAAVVVSRD